MALKIICAVYDEYLQVKQVPCSFILIAGKFVRASKCDVTLLMSAWCHKETNTNFIHWVLEFKGGNGDRLKLIAMLIS